MVVINSEEGEMVPSAEDGQGEEGEGYEALVPLVLVSNSTGRALEGLMAQAGSGEVRVRPVEASEETESLILGGYQVLNVRLQRG